MNLYSEGYDVCVKIKFFITNRFGKEYTSNIYGVEYI